MPAIEVDVPFEVVLQGAEPGLPRGHQCLDERQEHFGNHILPTVCEDGCCLMQKSVAGCIQGGSGEVSDSRWKIRASEGLFR